MNNVQFFLVAVPLGHTEDWSLRGRSTISNSNVIFCEDTRKFQDLVSRSGIKLLPGARVTSCAPEKERAISQQFLEEIQRTSTGNVWSFVSDAGTPIVNDPGAHLLRILSQAGAKIVAIPGPSAPIVAWQWSGGFGLPFVFAGFVPKARAGSKDLARFFLQRPSVGTFCFFDTRHQVTDTLEHLRDTLGAHTSICVAREMTKTHEELIRGTLGEVVEIFAKRVRSDQGIGELTVLLPGGIPESSKELDIAEIGRAIRQGKPKDAAKALGALIPQKSSKELYEIVLSWDQKKDK